MNQSGKSHPNSHGTEIRTYAQNRHKSEGTDSGSELNRLSGELNQRITREMSDFMSSASSQIQTAINEANNDQILSQIQASLGARQGQRPKRRWEAPVRRHVDRSEECLSCRFRNSSRIDCLRVPNRNEDSDCKSDSHDRTEFSFSAV